MYGIFTALVTPFNQNNEIDLAAFRKILRAQAAAGITGVIPSGSTGESPTLSLDEKKTLVLTALEELKGTGVKVLAGTGTNDTARSVEFSKWADEKGVDGVLLVSPYYNRPTQAGLEAHFSAIADAIQCEVMLYNHPGRSGVTISAETLVKLSKHPRIRTLKESSGSVTAVSEFIDALAQSKTQLDVLAGDDAAFLPFSSVGAMGLVSVSSNLIPAEMMKIYHLLTSNKWDEAKKLHQHYFPLFRDLFIDPNPVGIKWAMEYAGYCNARTRLPLTPITDAAKAKLKATLQRYPVISASDQPALKS